MIVFIKNYSLENIKNKLIILYILNAADIILTLLLLNSGFFIEANLLMTKAVVTPCLSFILKFALPFLLLVFIYFRMQKATDYQLRKSNKIINAAIIFYILVNISHLIWFTFLLILLSY